MRKDQEAYKKYIKERCLVAGTEAWYDQFTKNQESVCPKCGMSPAHVVALVDEIEMAFTAGYAAMQDRTIEDMKSILK